MDDIIRIGGVEYELHDKHGAGSVIGCSYLIEVTPKRKQTGWICRGCAARCYVIQTPSFVYPGSCGCGTASWRPFYGKVVE